jgi:hypothetical protein
MPMVAMFIIFDFIVYNPLHTEARKNLAYLDIISAHYARLDLASQGTLHDDVVAEFTSIARAYVNESSAARDHRTRDAAIGNGPNEVMVPSHSSETIQQAPQPSALLALGGGPDQDEMILVSHACHFLLIRAAIPRVVPLPRVKDPAANTLQSGPCHDGPGPKRARLFGFSGFPGTEWFFVHDTAAVWLRDFGYLQQPFRLSSMIQSACDFYRSLLY